MKNCMLFLSTILLIVSCKNATSTRYTQNSSEIEIVKATIKDYDYQEWDNMQTHYADTAKVYYNSRDNILSPKDLKAYFTRNDQHFSTRAFEEENREFEMIIDDDGKTWVNFWGLWVGNLDINNKKILIPVHITYQFKNNKIVQEFGYWNTSELVLEIQQLEERENLKEILEEEL